MRWWLASFVALGITLPLFAEAAPAIGAKVEDLHFKDIRYAVRSFADLERDGKRKAFVFVFVDTACPVVARYLPTLTKLDKEYRSKGVQFVAINSSLDDTIQEMAQQAVEAKVPFPFVRDIDGKCASALGAQRTPEVVVLDGDRKIRYRGRIDDQHLPDGGKPAPSRHDLKEALDSVLAGKKVEVESTPVNGCRIPRPGNAPGKQVTYNEHIAPILFKHCANCHRPGTAAPFSLMNFEQARRRGLTIAEVVADGKMPPWYAAPSHDQSFTNRQRLSPTERDLIAQWVAGNMPQGPGAAPNAPAFPEPDKEGWLIKPDLILETDVHELPAEGVIDYRYSVLPHVFWSETWIEAFQILPDNPKVVHHANLAYGSPAHGIKEANFLTGYVPGTPAAILDNGRAFRLPTMSALGLQIHYVATGKPEKSRLRLGIKFATGTVRKQMRFLLLDSTRMTIPANEPHHTITLTKPLEHDAEAVAIFAHMHLRGKAMVFRAVPPTGEPQTLLSIPNYSFGWQLSYIYEPGKLKLAKGTKLQCDAIFDNSAFNPFNPNHQALVRYGRQTHDEMINGFFFYVDQNEDLNLSIDGKTGRAKPKQK